MQEKQANSAGALECVAFVTSGQDYCIDISVVREIRGWAPPTPMPHSPDYVQGLFNLRGSVIPIIDLAKRLGLSTGEVSSRNVVIVVKIQEQLWGIVVDAVSDILTVAENELQRTPDVASIDAASCVSGVIPHEGKMLRALDLDTLLPARREMAA